MRLSKCLRVRVIGLLSMSILFAQMAVAAYVCPAMSRGSEAGMQSMAGMPCAAMMASGVALDPEQPGLCKQHCQFGSTSQVADPATPGVAPSAVLPVMVFLLLDGGEHALSTWVERERRRDRPPPLSHSLAHCCYRL